MKKFTFQAIALVLVVFAALAFSTGHLPNLSLQTEVKTTQLQIGGTKIRVEVADNDDKRSKGLGGRDSLAADSGMLFVFSKASFYNFWMKGLKFPLDLIWIKESSVVDITKNALPPAPGQPDQNLQIYTPSQAVDSVLEVNSGFIETHSIKIGDTIVK